MDDPLDNPKARELAAAHNVPTEQVAVWLATGYAAAEIERACQLGAAMQADPGDILAMRDAGMGWPAIQRALRSSIPINRDEDQPRGRRR